MRLSDRYIGRQVLVGTGFAIVVLSTVLVMGSLFQKLRPLLVDAGAKLETIREVIVASIPFSLIYTIPWAFLSAVLLVFGRMSSDHELTGFRVAGISLGRLSAPVFTIAGALSALCMWLNVSVAPTSNADLEFIFVKAFFSHPESMLRAAAERDGLARLEESAKNVRVYLGESDESGTHLKNLHIFTIPDPNNPDAPEVYVHAMSAQSEVDNEKKEFRFLLYDAYLESTEAADDDSDTADATDGDKDKDKTADGEDKPPQRKQKMVVAKEARPVVIPFDVRQVKPKPSTMSNQQIEDFVRSKPGMDERYKIGRYFAEIQRRYASSFACLAFAFIGIPLGIKARRKDTSTGLVLSLLIGAAYFVCGMAGGSTKTAVLLGVWGPNVVCVLLGLYLLRRARFR